MKGAKSLLPWYVNGSLDVEERQVVETWLQGDDDAAEMQRELQQFSAMMNRQEDRMPPRRVDARLFSQIRKQPSRWSGFLQWLWGFPVAVLLFALLWLIVQPGAQLQWSVRGDTVSEFRVYRAPVGSTTFELVATLPAVAGQRSYQYRDLAIFPGKSYHYTIEIVDQAGNISRSPVVASNPWESLVVYTTIVLTSFVLTFGMIAIASEAKFMPRTSSIGNG